MVRRRGAALTPEAVAGPETIMQPSTGAERGQMVIVSSLWSRIIQNRSSLMPPVEFSLFHE